MIKEFQAAAALLKSKIVVKGSDKPVNTTTVMSAIDTCNIAIGNNVSGALDIDEEFNSINDFLDSVLTNYYYITHNYGDVHMDYGNKYHIVNVHISKKGTLFPFESGIVSIFFDETYTKCVKLIGYEDETIHTFICMPNVLSPTQDWYKVWLTKV